MRFRSLVLIPLLVCAASRAADADAAGLYLQGHGGYGGKSASELAPGGTEPALGLALGAEVGARILAFNGYLSHDRYLGRGAISRVVLGFGGDAELGGFRLGGRIGAGLIVESGGVILGLDEDHTGMVARAGLALDRRLSPGLYLGVGIDGEYFALKTSTGVESSVHTGADVFGSLRLTFEVGI